MQVAEGDWDKARITAVLESSKKMRVHALLALYAAQTANERASRTTIEPNGVGFTHFDAEILTSIAQQLKARGSISAKQMQVLRSRLPKYWRQIGPLISPEVSQAMKEQEYRQSELGSW